MAYVKHMIVEGDTVQYLAQRYMNDPSKWLEIVLINDLKYPFIVNELRNESTPDYVKAIGEYITIPIEENYANSLKQELREDYNRALGEDLSLIIRGDTINLESGEFGEFTSTNKGDLATVKGIDNLKQAIIIRLATPYGSLLHHPNYGTKLYKFIGERDTYENREKMKIEIERTIRCDRRVKDITIEAFSVIDGVVRVNIVITPITLSDVIELGVRFNENGIIEWA